MEQRVVMRKRKTEEKFTIQEEQKKRKKFKREGINSIKKDFIKKIQM